VPPVIVLQSAKRSGTRRRWPHPGYGCRRVPYPQCSVTTRRPCCRPGDPGNARFNALRSHRHKGAAATPRRTS
jgi:hypothetical protein